MFSLLSGRHLLGVFGNLGWVGGGGDVSFLTAVGRVLTARSLLPESPEGRGLAGAGG